MFIFASVTSNVKQSILINKMNYKSNLGNIFDTYNPPVNLGYSNVSRSYNKISAKNGAEEHAGFGELQFMLENERKKFREAKDRFQTDLDNERKKRIEFQNKLIKLKDEFSRKEVIVSEAEFKINNLLHQNHDLAMENDRLKKELGRLEELYGGKIHELETQLNMETKNFEETTLQYNEQFDKFKKEGQEYVQQLSFEMERKVKNLEEKLKSTESIRRDLAIDNKRLNDLLISNKLQFQETIRDIKNRSRDEQIKKAQYLTKTFEQKLKLVEDSKEGLNRKIQELVRLAQDRDTKLMEQQRNYEDENSKLRQDISSMQEQVNQLNYIVNKLKSELAEKDNFIGRSVNEDNGELKMLKQQVESKKQENSQLITTIRQLKMAMKELQVESEKRKRDYAERCNSLQAEARRYKEDLTRLTQMLKSKINNTIDTVTYVKRDR